ncbi:MAG: hypothetical protein ACLSHG_08165 [Oscillospiraceae bacterium]
METIMQYIPLAVSAILLAALILTVITNIITQVLKKITWDKIPTNVLAVVVAMAVTLVSFFAACQIMGWAVTWYMVAGAVALGLFVSYAAMFGFDKLREALEQITNWGKDKTGKEDPRHRVGAGGSLSGKEHAQGAAGGGPPPGGVNVLQGLPRGAAIRPSDHRHGGGGGPAGGLPSPGNRRSRRPPGGTWRQSSRSRAGRP